MRMTPLDIQSHRFRRRLRGIDPEEVDDFLRMISEDYENLLRENETQRSRIADLEEQVEALEAQEKLLQETLVSAQSISEKMRSSAEKECELRIGAAEVRAEKIIDASHRRAARLAENIRELRGMRARIAESLRTAIQTQMTLIDNLTIDPEAGSIVDDMVEGKVAFLDQIRAPRHSGVDEDRTTTHRGTGRTASYPLSGHSDST